MKHRPTGKRIALPQRQRHYRFALTPLADAMFQLLVFFMLSANLTPYSLLGLRAGTVAGTVGAEGTSSTTGSEVTGAGDTVIWSVNRESVVASGQRFGFDALPRLAEAMQQAGTMRVLLVTRPDAQVQGLVSVLETLASHGITDVQIADIRGSTSQPQPDRGQDG